MRSLILYKIYIIFIINLSISCWSKRITCLHCEGNCPNLNGKYEPCCLQRIEKFNQNSDYKTRFSKLINASGSNKIHPNQMITSKIPKMACEHLDDSCISIWTENSLTSGHVVKRTCYPSLDKSSYDLKFGLNFLDFNEKRRQSKSPAIKKACLCTDSLCNDLNLSNSDQCGTKNLLQRFRYWYLNTDQICVYFAILLGVSVFMCFLTLVLDFFIYRRNREEHDRNRRGRAADLYLDD